MDGAPRGEAGAQTPQPSLSLYCWHIFVVGVVLQVPLEGAATAVQLRMAPPQVMPKNQMKLHICELFLWVNAKGAAPIPS